MAIDSHVRAGTQDAHRRAVTRVIGTMRERLDAGMSLGDMAGVAYMSRFHFDRTFRAVTGVRPRQYLRALRLQAAKRLLVETTSSVTDVCLDVGYSSLGTFIRSFTNLLGVSPQRFRLLAHKADHHVPVTLAAPSNRHDREGVVSGQVTAPETFAGPVFIGLFATAIPQGLPIACTIAVTSGPYRITGVREGSYHLFALGVAWSASSRELILGESALRAGGLRIEVRDGQSLDAADLNLRQPEPLDPPVLVTLPMLLARRAALAPGLRRRGTRIAAAG
jgi:AraC-like DNA-binding protein